MPPPDPRSRTVSPGLSWASAVGLPHPRDAFTASAGRMLVCELSYRSLVIGSTSVPHAAAPQHELLCPATTLRAASPYLACTTSLISSGITTPLLLNGSRLSFAVQQLCSGCSIRHKESRAVLLKLLCSLCNAGKCSLFEPEPGPHSSVSLNGVTAWSWQSQVLRRFHPPPSPRGGPSREAAKFEAWVLPQWLKTCRQIA